MAVPVMYSVVKAQYIGVGPRPEDWQNLLLIYPTVLLSILCAHNETVMLEHQHCRDKSIDLLHVN